MLQGMQYALARLMPEIQLAGTFASLGTLTAPPTTLGPTGNPTGPFTPVSGVVDIPCMDAPPSMARLQATEVKAVAEVMSKGLRHVLLNKCFPGAPATPTQPGWSGLGYRFVVDGIVYDLLGAENDSQGIMTRLDLQLVTI